MGKLLYEDEAYAIRGACYDVYKTLGSGFLEAVYQEALALELKARGIPFAEQVEIAIQYKGAKLQHTYRPDFICYDKIIVELKALSALAPEHEAQVLNYLKATDSSLALLVNFGHYPGVEIKRIAR